MIGNAQIQKIKSMQHRPVDMSHASVLKGKYDNLSPYTRNLWHASDPLSHIDRIYHVPGILPVSVDKCDVKLTNWLQYMQK